MLVSQSSPGMPTILRWKKPRIWYEHGFLKYFQDASHIQSQSSVQLQLAPTLRHQAQAILSLLKRYLRYHLLQLVLKK